MQQEEIIKYYYKRIMKCNQVSKQNYTWKLNQDCGIVLTAEKLNGTIMTPLGLKKKSPQNLACGLQYFSSTNFNIKIKHTI